MNNDKKMGGFVATYEPTNWADRNKNALVDEDLAVEERPAPKTLMDYINRHRRR